MDQSSHPDAVADFRFTRARANAAFGRQADAIADARQSLDTFERIRSSLLPLDFVKRGYRDLIQDVFDFTVGALEESGRDAEAVTTAEAARGRALADLLASRMTRAAPSTPGSAERGAATLLTGRPRRHRAGRPRQPGRDPGAVVRGSVGARGPSPHHDRQLLGRHGSQHRVGDSW